jgi:hypothetical protein
MVNLRLATSGYDDALIRENSLYLSWLAEDYILLSKIELAAEGYTSPRTRKQSKFCAY